jgi:hypothetical protein
MEAGDGNFSGILTIEPSADCLLMALVDYQVVPFSFNGSYDATHYLSGNYDATNYTGSCTYGTYTGVFSISSLSEGFHDVVFLGIVSPYNYSTSPFGALVSGGAMRFNVVVGNATKPVVSFENRSNAVNAVYSSGGGYFSTLSGEPFGSAVSSQITLKPGSTYDYYVNVGHATVNGEKRNTSLAIVQLLDYEQVPVLYGTGNDVYYGYIDRDENCSVYMSFKAPETEGPHRLINIVVTDPYADLWLSPGEINTKITQLITFEHLDFTVAE